MSVTASGEGPLIFIIAGEPSGDLLGGRLMAALKQRTRGRVRFVGIGGDEMSAEGLVSVMPMAELSVMGFVEILPRLPHLLRRIRETAAMVAERRPDALVTVDSPGFSFRVAKRVAGLGIPLIHYVAPSVWAYAPGRAKRIAKFLDHVLALLPFEPPYFEAVGLPCTYVGHPVVEYGAERGDGAGFRARHGIPPDAPVLSVLPGSRQGEIARLLPEFQGAVALLARQFPNLHVVVATVSTVADAVAKAIASWPVPTVLVRDRVEKYNAFAASNAALAASGTVSVELAVCSVPHVVGYRINPITAFVGRRIWRVNFASLVNLVMDRAIVPEFLHENCRSDKLAAAVTRLLADTDVSALQQRELREALTRMGLGETAPSQRAADVVLDVIANRHHVAKHTEEG